MYRRLSFGLLSAFLVVWSSACEEAPADRVLSIDATGTIVGLAYLDRNGTGTLEPTVDGRVPSVGVRLVPRGGGGTIATTVSDASGGFVFSDVPVGEYELRVDNATVPDSVLFIKVDSANLRVLAGDSLGVTVVFSFPSLNVRQARTMAAGKRVFVEGVTHNSHATFGDSSIHIADTTGAIRATRVAPVAVPFGTRVRLLGTTSTQNGQPVLTDVTLFSLGPGSAPAPVVVSTAVAASADGGKLDAALVQVTGAVIIGSQTNTALDVILTVNDGSGVLDIVIDRQAQIPVGTFVPGASLSAIGLLVPSGTAGVWQLKPRTTADVSASVGTVTIAEARQLPSGRAVTIEGVALNSWFSFADSTVHVNDATGSIRAVRVAPVNLFAGDRVRMVGTITLRDGQPILTNVTASVLGAGVLPLAEVVSTAVAATADNGRLDAALVKVVAAAISATATVSGDLVVTVNDGTGPLDVVLDRDIGFALAPFVPGAVLDVTGVLITTTGGAVWRLKPRQPSDVIVR